jgi:mercuric ion transport protein
MSESKNNDLDKIKANTGIFAGTSLAILGTTCCALPIALVSVGLGGAIASLFSNVPWLVTISKYKVVTFTSTGLLLVYSWYALCKLEKSITRAGQTCAIKDQKMIKWQKRILWFSTALFAISVFAAYALLPIRMWLDGLQGS